MSRSGQSHRKCFQELLAESLPANAARLMNKARRFSRLAKAVPNAGDRKLAYLWKNRCVKHLLDHCGGVVRRRHDPSDNDWGIILVNVEGCPGWLHTHPRWLTNAA